MKAGAAAILALLGLMLGSCAQKSPLQARTGIPKAGQEPPIKGTIVKKPRPHFLDSGVRVTDLRIGTGREAHIGQVVRVRYKGLLENGKVFQKTPENSPPPHFILCSGPGGVIPGFAKGLVGMREGGERRIEVPWQLAYGKQAQPGIPPRSNLVFNVKLVYIP